MSEGSNHSVAAGEPPLPPARSRATVSVTAALTLLVLINLFNYIDRYILAAVEPSVRHQFFAPDDPDAQTKMGFLATAFMVSYMVLSPIFGVLADRTGIETVYRICAFLPAIGLLAAFLPRIERARS